MIAPTGPRGLAAAGCSRRVSLRRGVHVSLLLGVILTGCGRPGDPGDAEFLLLPHQTLVAGAVRFGVEQVVRFDPRLSPDCPRVGRFVEDEESTFVELEGVVVDGSHRLQTADQCQDQSDTRTTK